MKRTGWKIKTKLPVTYAPYRLSPKTIQAIQKIKKLKSDDSAWPPELHGEIEDACGIYLAQRRDEVSKPTETEIGSQLQDIEKSALALRSALLISPYAVSFISQKANELCQREANPQEAFCDIEVRPDAKIKPSASVTEQLNLFYKKIGQSGGLQGLKAVAKIGSGEQFATILEKMAIVAELLQTDIPAKRSRQRPPESKQLAKQRLLENLAEIFQEKHGTWPLRPNKYAESRGPLDALMEIIGDDSCLGCGNCSKLIRTMDNRLRLL